MKRGASGAAQLVKVWREAVFDTSAVVGPKKYREQARCVAPVSSSWPHTADTRRAKPGSDAQLPGIWIVRVPGWPCEKAD